MRFSILKKWLPHRRAKSDTFMHFSNAQGDLASSNSASAIPTTIEAQVQPDLLPHPPALSPLAFIPSPAQVLNPSISVSSPSPVHVSSPTSAKQTPTGVALRFGTLKERLSVLEEERNELERVVEHLQDKIRKERDHSSSTSRQNTPSERTRTEAYEHVKRHRDAFAKALEELGLANTVDSEMSEEAIIDAILKASEDESNAWTTILSAVVGPLAPENYVSAINITLEARKELRSVNKVAKFWKRSAQRNDGSVDLVTPSASTLSQIKEPLSPERQQAMERLRSERKSGIWVDGGSTARARMSTALPYLLPSAESGANLAPLASQTFREQLRAAHSTAVYFLVLRQNTFDAILPIIRNRPILHILCQYRPYSGIEQLDNVPGATSGSQAATSPQVSLLQAEQALHSFERICSSFPSSNFSSLNAISEEAPTSDDGMEPGRDGKTSTISTNASSASQPNNEVVVAVEVDRSEHCKPGVHSSTKENACEASDAVPTSPRTSIPVLRSLSRRLSITSPPKALPPPGSSTHKKPRSALKLTSPPPSRARSDSSPLAPKTSPSSRFKPVAPLRIIKKNKASLPQVGRPFRV
ncbi:hypothetical protein VNI00_000850 [Paramarasmius palmivorus]|uniref:Uncharacterized protein n=1 Tax=Paramarasmius palmivorus TaxID=297713 RepID=A0AAW0EA98_9AGAR